MLLPDPYMGQSSNLAPSSKNLKKSNLVPNSFKNELNSYVMSKRRRKGRLFDSSYLFFVLLFCANLLNCSVANKPPQFVLSEGQSEIVLRLKEGKETPVGTLITKLKGFDYDDDPLVFGIRGQVGNELLKIENLGTDEASVYLKKELDREVEEEYMFVLTLTDGRLAEGSFVTQSLLILVEDINDNSPQCITQNSTIRVPENSDVPRELTTIECTDIDEGPYGQVIYKLQTEPGDEDIFSISTSNGKGILKLLQPLDYDKKFLYQLRVLAVDRANTGQINTATNAILVQVEDVSDRPPEWLVVPPVTRIREDVPKGTFVLQVRAIDGDHGVNNRITYSLLNENELFGVESDTGTVYTKSVLDREDERGGSYILQLKATEQTNSKTKLSVNTEVTVLLLDVNDETPTFSSRSYIAEVVENSPVDVPVTFLGDSVAECYDHDLGLNGTFRLYTEGDGGVFDVTPSQGINQVSFLVRVKNPMRLDYERLKVINFTLVAEEVGQEKKRSKVPITVFLKDANDNSLTFEKDIYKVRVNENSPPGTIITQIRATDKDSGIYGTEGIRFTSLSGSIANELKLDPLTGILSTVQVEKSLLDREIASIYYLTVEARDNNGKGNRNTVQVQLQVNDLNDERPTFMFSRYEGRVFENEHEFISPLICEAKDNDLPNTPNSKIQYSIVSGNEDGYFQVDRETGQVNIINPIDFEKLPSDSNEKLSNLKKINFTVRANDLGTPPLFSIVPVTVWVLDQNDFAPTFKILIYNKIIREDTPPGTIIAQVEAIDRDASTPFNKIFYRIEKGAQDKFLLNSETGVVKIAPGANLDYNINSFYILEITAVDGGGLQSPKNTVLNITILDINNKPPSFIYNTNINERGVRNSDSVSPNAGIFHGKIKENSVEGSYITQIRATDPDNKPILRYSINYNKSEGRDEEGRIVHGVNLKNIIEMNSIDGVVKVGPGGVDREKVAAIKLHVEVEDKGSENGRQVETGLLLIEILDEEDNSPTFSQSLYTASIAENSPNGTLVLSVLAFDPDLNSNPTYSLSPSQYLSNSQHYPLSIAPSSGAISVSGTLDREVSNWLNFTVVATDSEGGKGEARVNVKILDENDNSPIFRSGSDKFEVKEDLEVGGVVGVVEATDRDEGSNGRVTYILDRKSSMGKFTIDPDSGAIRVSARLDREETPSYSLVVQAWDNWFGTPSPTSRTSFKNIFIKLLDTNDNAPEWGHETGDKFSVSEFHELNMPIGAVWARDRDSGESGNSWVSYRIKSGNELGLFRVDGSGREGAKIMAARSLKGFYGNYTISIEATDGGRPPLSATKDFQIQVTDFNDNSPRFLTAQNLTIRVPENATIGTTLLQIRAIDSDTGLNGVVRYRFRKDITGHSASFLIDSTTGVISLAKALEREKQKLYHIRVEAYDLGQIPLSSDLDLTIKVENVEEFQPVFEVKSIQINFTENIEPGKELRILPRTSPNDDDDSDKPSQVCYFLLPDSSNSSKIFYIEPYEHFIATQVPLDRELKSNYSLKVVSTTNCAPNGPFSPRTLNSALKILIKVRDLNDNRPIFERSIFTGGISTSSDYGSEILTLVASDKDEENSKNSALSYFILPPITMALTEGLGHLVNLENQLFAVNKTTGVLSLNFDPQPDMKGYFTIEVAVNDTYGLSDRAKVLVYLLREDQKVKVVVRKNPSDVRSSVSKFVQTLSNITGATVNVDNNSFKFHENSDGSVDKTKTDFFIHFVHPEKNIVLETEAVLKLIDLNIEELDELFKEFNVIDTSSSKIVVGSSKSLGGETKSLLMVYLGGSAGFLAIILFVVISICFAQRAKYQRRLKAATATAYGSSSMVIPRTGNLPNTNVHSVEGSNPIWMQAYHNNWYKEDSISENSETRDSLDEQTVIGTTEDSSPPSSHLRSFVGSDRDLKRSKNLDYSHHHSRNYHKNLMYNNKLDTNSTCLILKKHLETTEL